jgi:hypothetical protein
MNLYLAAALACAVIGIAWLIWEARHAPDIADYLGVSEMEAADLFDGILHGDLDSNVAPGLMATLLQESTGGATTAPAHDRRYVRRVRRRVRARFEGVRASGPGVSSRRSCAARRFGCGAQLASRRESCGARQAKGRNAAVCGRDRAASPRRACRGRQGAAARTAAGIHPTMKGKVVVG